MRRRQRPQPQGKLVPSSNVLVDLRRRPSLDNKETMSLSKTNAAQDAVVRKLAAHDRNSEDHSKIYEDLKDE